MLTGDEGDILQIHGPLWNRHPWPDAPSAASTNSVGDHGLCAGPG